MYELLRRLRILFSPAVRLQVWQHTLDRRTNEQRDRDLESTWRARVRANERGREHDALTRRACLPIALEPGEALDALSVDNNVRMPIAIPAIRFTRRQAT